MAILAIAVLFAGSVVAYRYWPQTQSDSPSTFRFEEPAPDNPQLTFATTFRNVRPGVKYVGDQSCKACHEEIHKSFHQHPMGRSATLSSDPMLGDRYDIATRPSFTSPDGREYRVEQINDQTIHSEIFISRDNQKLATSKD